MKLLYLALCLAFAVPALAKPVARTLVKASSPITAFAYSPDGRALASADESGRVWLTDVKSGATEQSFRYKEQVKSLAFAPTGQVLVIGLRRQIRLLNTKGNMKTSKPILVLKTTHTLQYTLQFSTDGRILLATEAIEHGLSFDSRYTIEIWEVESGKRVRRFNVMTDTGSYPSTLAPDGQTFIAPTGKVASLYSVATGKEIRALSDHFSHDTPPFEVPFIGTFAWSPDGQWIAGTGSYFEADGHLTVWDAHSGRIKWSEAFADYGSALAWSPDSSRIAVGTIYDTTYDDAPDHLHQPTGAAIFNAKTGQWQRSVQRLPGEIETMCWSPDGKTLATEHGKRIELWDVSK